MYDEVELDEGGGMGKMQAGFSRKWQTWMDKAAPHTTPRWLATAFIMLVYCIRVYFINGAPARTTPVPRVRVAPMLQQHSRWRLAACAVRSAV